MIINNINVKIIEKCKPFVNHLYGAGTWAAKPKPTKAADGAPIEWNFSSKKSLDATKKLFEDNGVAGINLKYTLPKPQ